MTTLKILKSGQASTHLHSYKEKFCISTSEGLFFIQRSDIVYMKSESNYTRIFLKNEQVLLCSKTLKVFADALGSEFLRVHHSYLINPRLITWVESNYNQLSLCGKVKIPISRANKSLLRQQVKKLFQTL